MKSKSFYVAMLALVIAQMITLSSCKKDLEPVPKTEIVTDPYDPGYVVIGGDTIVEHNGDYQSGGLIKF